MQIQIRNIGVVKEADIDLKGMTVLAGANGTGKTTVAKVLATTSDFVLDWENIFDRYTFDLYKRDIDRPFFDIVDTYAVSLRQKLFQNSFRLSIDECYELILKGDYDKIIQIYKALIIEANLDIATVGKENINKFEKDFLPSLTQRLLSNKKEFFEQLPDYFSEKIGGYFNKNFKHTIRLNADDDTILDFGHNYGFYFNINTVKSRFFERSFLIASDCKPFENLSKYPFPSQPLDETELVDEFENFIEGKFKDVASKYLFVDRSNQYFDLEFVASGVNHVAPIYQLLVEKKIGKNCLLIIDEPETNLHPEWLLKYARLLTGLVKAGVTILLSTHSPIFIAALKKYSKKMNLEPVFSYYLAEKSPEDGKVTFSNYSDDIDQLQSSLFAPFHRIVWSDND